MKYAGLDDYKFVMIDASQVIYGINLTYKEDSPLVWFEVKCTLLGAYCFTGNGDTKSVLTLPHNFKNEDIDIQDVQFLSWFAQSESLDSFFENLKMSKLSNSDLTKLEILIENHNEIIK